MRGISYSHVKLLFLIQESLIQDLHYFHEKPSLTFVFNHFDYTAEGIAPPLQAPSNELLSTQNNNSQSSIKPSTVGTVVQPGPPNNNFSTQNNSNFTNSNGADPYLQNGLGYSPSLNKFLIIIKLN